MKQKHERTKQGSGSIGIWACMSYDEVKFIKLFKGRLNADAYQKNLENNLIPSIDLMTNKEETIFCYLMKHKTFAGFGHFFDHSKSLHCLVSRNVR